MTQLSLPKRFYCILIMLIALSNSLVFAQDEEPDPTEDEVEKQMDVIKQKLYLEAKSQYELGKAAYAEANFADARDKFLAAEQILDEVSLVKPEVRELKDEVNLLLQKTFIAYADQLINEAERIRKISKFNDAKDLLAKALSHNQELQPEVDLMLEKIKAGEAKLTYDNLTDPQVVDPDKRDRELNVAVNIENGKTFWKHRQYVRSRDSFERALIVDPGNEEAIHFLSLIYEKLYSIAQKRRTVMRKERIAEIEWKWIDHIPPQDSPVDLNISASDDGNETLKTIHIHEKLKTIIIPNIDFVDASVETVFSYLKERSKSLDVKGDGRGVNILYIKPTKKSAPAADEGGDAVDGGFDDVDVEAPADDEVSETLITIEIDEIPLGDAIHYICKQAKLSYVVEENAVVVSPEDYTTEKMETRFYAVDAGIFSGVTGGGGGDDLLGGDDGGGDGTDYKGYFEKYGVSFPTSGNETATISYDARLSKLIVRNTPAELRKMEKILKEINIQTPQVTIEAKFVEVRQTNVDELSFRWAYMGTTSGGQLRSQRFPQTYPDFTPENPNDNPVVLDGDGNPLGEDIRFADSNGLPPGHQQQQHNSTSLFYNPDGYNNNSLSAGVRDLTNILTGSSGTALLSIDSIIQGNQFNTLIYALSQKQGTDILSAPKVTVHSGIEAYIAMAEERRFPESYDGGDIVFAGNGDNQQPILEQPTPEFGEARDDIGITLRVTPTVQPDGLSIQLELAPKVVEYLGLDQDFNQRREIPNPEDPDNPIVQEVNFGTPIFEVREVITTVTVWDGETVILGGTIKDIITKVHDKVPFLGDLPIIGRLFQSKGEQSEKRNLLIFVSARIIDPAGQPIRDINVRGKPDFRR